jgi:hypothetical protein
MSAERVKVLYIGGYGRSGSTLLVRLLGQLRGLQAVGEMWNIWQKSFVDNELCGCGSPFHECAFWGAVVQEAFGGFHAVALDEIHALRRTVRSQTYLPLLLYPRLRTGEQQRRIQDYTAVLSKLYTAIRSVSGCQAIIDSSKGPRYAMLLRETPGIDLRVVHLVRDSRAVVYSWQKKMVKPEVYWKTAYMDRPNPVSAALNWNVTNLLTQSFHHNGAAYLFVRYEDLVASPRSCLARIARFAGVECDEDDLFEQEDAPTFSVDHTAVGNPNRFRQGPVKLRRDDEWQSKMPGGHRRLVTTLTLPLLRKYGYLDPLFAAERNGSL